ncbi:MAG: AAA family ATPase, partial [Actinobacteria bacterium]|nr:AAA family ATPase [Actinomycetota bacterium]
MAAKSAGGRTAARSPTAQRPTPRRPTSASRAASHGHAKSGGRSAAAGDLLGREEQLRELSELLGRERLVTLTGAPGIGKTRLAGELAARPAAGFAGGAHVVDLAPLARPAQLPRAVAGALGVAEQPGQAVTKTIIARVDRRRVLLVLDNCEHLLDACTKLVEALLSACPQLRILTTSREPLAIAAERVWEVPALSVPDAGEDLTPEALARYAAVELLVQRAREVEPGFALTAYLVPVVAEIVRRLDGIPLAIEFAAARVESLTPQEIARRLEDRLDLPTAGAPAQLARHQTLAGALDWSYELLSDSERAVLRRLSVFVGGFEVEAAEAVCSGEEVARGEVGEALARLAAKSLVDSDRSATTRHRLLETIRAYAGERLDESGERAEVRGAHARFYLALAERAEPQLTGPDQDGWLERLEVERPNLRSALEWSLSHGEV